MNKLFYILAGGFAIATGASFTLPPQNLIAQGKDFTNIKTDASIVAQRLAQRPTTKTATIRVEGERTEISLKLYTQEDVQFSTYYPARFFVPELGSAGEGTGIRFVVNTEGKKNSDAYVHFFFPAYRTNLTTIRQMVAGKRGLLANNKWKVVSTSRNVPYRWAKEKFSFQQRKGNNIILGNVYIGEYKGNAFYAISHFPGEYGDGFSPRADLIFQNLQFGK